MENSQQRPVRVAMLSYYFYPEYSGSAMQAANLIRALRMFGVESFIISARLDPQWPLQEMVDGVQVYRVPLKNPKSILSFWASAARMLWKLRRRYDILHSHGMNPFHGLPIFIAHLLGKPTLGKLSIARSDINFSGQGRVFGRLHKWFLGFADKCVAISTSLLNEALACGLHKDKCLMIPNGVDTLKFFPPQENEKRKMKKAMGYDEDELIVLFAGVVDHRKGVDVLLPAFRKAAEGISQAKLLIVGPVNREDAGGDYYHRIKETARNSGAATKIRFYERTKRIQDYYRMADIFVLPSRQEGLPNVVLEAMASGLPVIGTRISGTEDMIRDNGFLVPKEDVEALAEAIGILLRSETLRKTMGNQSRSAIAEYYSIDAVSERYAALYQELTAERRPVTHGPLARSYHRILGARE